MTLDTWECVLHLHGRAVVHVLAEDEEEAMQKAEEYDPWDLDVEITDADCDMATRVVDAA